MEELIKQIRSISPQVKAQIDSRMQEFASFKLKSEEEWFSELCFCLLTANAKAKTALALQSSLGFNGFYKMPEQKLVEAIKSGKHRFHNVKAARIVEARKHYPIKQKINQISQSSQREARDWLVNNVKGLGLKEASHFLRNTGHENVAIIDRHIINILAENNLSSPNKSLNRNSYLVLEETCEKLGEKLNMSLSKLDLSLWYLKTGEVLK